MYQTKRLTQLHL